MADEVVEWVPPGGTALLLTQRTGGKGRWMPPVKLTVDRIAGVPGARVRQVSYDAANIVVPVLVSTATADAYRTLVRTMASSLRPDAGPGLLRSTFTHDDGSVEVRQLAAYYVDGMGFPEDDLTTGYPSLLFTSDGPPYWTDAADTTGTYGIAGSAYTWFPIGGSTWAPLALNASSVFTLTTVVLGGDAPAYPVWTLTGPISGQVQFDNLTTGKSLWLNFPIAAGQSAVVIDTRPGAKSVTQGGANLYRYLTAYDLWAFQPGRNDISITVPGATSATRVGYAYRRGYLAA